MAGAKTDAETLFRDMAAMAVRLDRYSDELRITGRNHTNAMNLGMTAEAMNAAEGALFNAVNTADAYGDIPGAGISRHWRETGDAELSRGLAGAVQG